MASYTVNFNYQSYKLYIGEADTILTDDRDRMIRVGDKVLGRVILYI